MTTPAIVLAAGASTRMGSPKQLIELDGEPLVVCAVKSAQAAGCDPVVTVLGAHFERIAPVLAASGARIVHNPAWQEGMASSIRAGLDALPPDSSDVLILLCDQPRVSAAELAELLALHHGQGRALTAALYDGIAGVPAVFARSMFAELLALTGDSGARRVIQRHRSNAAFLDMPSAAFDCDTPEDRINLYTTGRGRS